LSAGWGKTSLEEWLQDALNRWTRNPVATKWWMQIFEAALKDCSYAKKEKEEKKKKRKERKSRQLAADSYGYGTNEPLESLLIFSVWGISVDGRGGCLPLGKSICVYA
jgi:hypothetical protein